MERDGICANQRIRSCSSSDLLSNRNAEAENYDFTSAHAELEALEREAEKERNPPDVSSDADFPSLASAKLESSGNRPISPAVASAWAARAPPGGRSFAETAQKASNNSQTAFPEPERAFELKKQRQQQGPTKQRKAMVAPTVGSGEETREQYEEAREKASEFARQRNALFEQATKAYMAGDKAKAKELSRKGHEQAQLMWEAHEEAASTIFSQRNRQLQNGGGPPCIDLHGLHPREAEEALRRELKETWRRLGAGCSVQVVVGAGKHNKKGKASVPKAAKEFLSSRNITFSEPVPGTLQLQLPGSVASRL